MTSTTTSTTRKTTSTASTASSTTRLTPVQMKLQGHTNLASRLQSRLPAGTNLTTASAGFRNLGQFVGAVNVCHNLGIPFAELKTRMVERHMSLGQVIQDARPTAIHSTTIASQAESDADLEIRSTTATSSTTTATGTRKHGGH
jgi:hypothetical protein